MADGSRSSTAETNPSFAGHSLHLNAGSHRVLRGAAAIFPELFDFENGTKFYIDLALSHRESTLCIWCTRRLVLERFRNYCGLIKIAKSGFPWEKTTKASWLRSTPIAKPLYSIFALDGGFLSLPEIYDDGLNEPVLRTHPVAIPKELEKSQPSLKDCGAAFARRLPGATHSA